MSEVVYSRDAAKYKYEVYYKRHDKYSFEFYPLAVFYAADEAIKFTDKNHENDPTCTYEVRREEINHA